MPEGIDQRSGQMRHLRLALGLSQHQFAASLGVSLESYRRWDAGRRETPDDVMRRALALVNGANVDAPIPLAALSRVLRINKGTLRAAAHDGDFLQTGSTIRWSARNPSSGFEFESESPNPARLFNAAIGHIRNGVFFE